MAYYNSEIQKRQANKPHSFIFSIGEDYRVILGEKESFNLHQTNTIAKKVEYSPRLDDQR